MATETEDFSSTKSPQNFVPPANLDLQLEKKGL
jgi:hypothetical protein